VSLFLCRTRITADQLETPQNLDAVLKGSGMSLKNVVKANIYLSNLSRDFNVVNEVRVPLLLSPYLILVEFELIGMYG